MSRRQKPLRPIDPRERGIGPLARLGDGAPRAVTFSTRPPSATIRVPSRRVPAWKIMTPSSLRRRIKAADLASPWHSRRGSRSWPSPRSSAVSSLQRRLKRSSTPSAVASSAARRSDLQPHHQHLAFRIAEADIIFDQLGPVRRRSSARHRARPDTAMPRACRAATVGWMIASMVRRARISGVMTGAGE